MGGGDAADGVYIGDFRNGMNTINIRKRSSASLRASFERLLGDLKAGRAASGE